LDVSLWRAVWRLVALAVWTTTVVAYLRVSRAVLTAGWRMKLWGEPSGMRLALAFHRWARRAAKILGMRFESRGTPPQPPFLLVSNHLSYVDIVLIGALVPGIFVAKSELAGWPLVGSMCRSVDTLFIDRERKRDVVRVMSQAEKLLGEGRGVIVFPEGTSTRGETVIKFNPSLLQIAARSENPVCYATLYYETPPGSPAADQAICWYGGTEFVGHALKLVRLPWFRARVTFGAEPIRGGDRKELAARLHAAVMKGFQPIVEPGTGSS
jgi:1-acyl-sn-glycerol-3-phosphate acyltransferase